MSDNITGMPAKDLAVQNFVVQKHLYGCSESRMKIPVIDACVVNAIEINTQFINHQQVTCSLVDACVGGPNDVLTTVADAVNNGFNRIRIRGNVTETVAVIALPSFTHIWIDGGVTWTLPINTTLDATGSETVWISGNSNGRLVFSRSTSGSLITAPINQPTTYVFENLNIDFSATTASNVQMCPKSALQRYRNLDVTLPNVVDIQFFDFSNELFDPTDAETSTSAENIILRGTGTLISNIIGHTPGLATVAGNYRNITLTGILPVGNGTFTQPLISLFGAIGGGSVTFDTLVGDIGPLTQLMDIIMSGNCSRILRRNLGGSPVFNMRVIGNAAQTIEDCTVNILDVTATASQFSNVTCGILNVSGNNNVFANLMNQFGVTAGMILSGNQNRFTTSQFVAPVGLTAITVTGNDNLFSACTFVDVDVVNPGPGAVFLTISGTGNILSGCRKIDTGAAPAASRNLEITSTANITTIVGTNLVTQSAAGTAGNSITFSTPGSPPFVQVSTNTIDTAFVGAPGGGSVLSANMVV